MLVIIGESNPVLQRAGRLQVRRGDAQGQPASCTRACSSTRPRRSVHWHIPAAHYLEAWSDARTIDGTVSIVQPLIQPLYGGKSAHEVIATMSERPERAGYDVVREYWQATGATVRTVHSAAGAARAGANECICAPVRQRTLPHPPHPLHPLHLPHLRARATVREDVAQVAARRLHCRLGGDRGATPATVAPDVATRITAGARRSTASRSTSAATRRSTTAASRTTAGCRNCPSR